MPLHDTSRPEPQPFYPSYEIGYTQITSNTNISDTLEVTATALISPGALTFDGAPVIVEFFAPAVITDTGGAGDLVTFTLFEGVTQLGRLAAIKTIVTAAPDTAPIFARYRFTPTAGAHTYKLCAFATVTTGTPLIVAGAGGTGVPVPAYVRFTKV